MMKSKTYKPIIFNPVMVRAILRNQKTQTRRIITGSIDKPPYKAGDMLWVRENFIPYPVDMGADYDKLKVLADAKAIPYFKAKDGKLYWVVYPADWVKFREVVGKLRVKPSIHMPRTACRIELRVKSCRAEPLQDITKEDIKAEGVEHYILENIKFGNIKDKDSLLQSWKSLWDGINSPRGYGWDENPMLWVVDFEVSKVSLFRSAIEFGKADLENLKGYYGTHSKIRGSLISSLGDGLKNLRQKDRGR